jgi:hypothetical protein
MSPVVTEILEQIDRLSPIEQANIFRQLAQKIETTTNLNTPQLRSIFPSSNGNKQSIKFTIEPQSHSIAKKPEFPNCLPNSTQMKTKKTNNKP